MSADVLKSLGGTAASANWSEGAWSTRRGFPSSVVLHDGRLWWAGRDNVWGSVSDAYNSFDEDYEGDAGPISRSIGSGPVDVINWLASADNLHIGGQGAEYVCRASTLDEPLTPTEFGMKAISTLGSANIRSIKIDTSIVFVNKNNSRVYEISYDSSNYSVKEFTSIIPEIGNEGFVRIAVQRQPDTRIHCIRADGTAAVLVFDKVEEVSCWLEIETDGEIEDVLVIPDEVEDAVYYTVKRAINGVDKRYFERFALLTETLGGADNRIADSFSIYSGASTNTITGLEHLEGKSVVVWGNSKPLGTYTVSSGSITLSEEVTWCCVGLHYRARFKSSKLGLTDLAPLARKQRISTLGVVLADVHAKGLKYGSSFDLMDDLPAVIDGVVVDENIVFDELEISDITVPNGWGRNTALCLEANAPMPCTVLAAVVDGEEGA